MEKSLQTFSLADLFVEILLSIGSSEFLSPFCGGHFCQHFKIHWQAWILLEYFCNILNQFQTLYTIPSIQFSEQKLKSILILNINNGRK
jgi:hypothetical protein